MGVGRDKHKGSGVRRIFGNNLRYIACISGRACILGLRMKIKSLPWGCICCVVLHSMTKNKSNGDK